MGEIQRRKAEEEQKRLEQQEQMNQPRQQRQFQVPPQGGATGANPTRTRG